MTTKNQIMLDCLRQLSMVYGTSVNKYAEDKLYSFIDDALEVCFKEHFWGRHIKKYKTRLVNGYPASSNFNQVCREFEDIQTIMSDNNYPDELAKANYSMLPSQYTGSTPLYFQYADEDATKIFRTIPTITSTKVDEEGTTYSPNVYVIFRTLCRPAVYTKFLNGSTIIPAVDLPFTYLPEDELPFDALALKYKTCYNYMVIKGDNPEATQSFAGLYKERIEQLRREETNNTLSYRKNPTELYSSGWLSVNND